MKRCRFHGRYGLFGASKRPGNAMVEVGLCNDESCDDDEGEYKDREAASVQAKRQHCRGFEQMPEAFVDSMVKALCHGKSSEFHDGFHYETGVESKARLVVYLESGPFSAG